PMGARQGRRDRDRRRPRLRRWPRQDEGARVILGRVIGEVWATRKDPRLAGAKLLLIRPHGFYEPAFDSRHLVAADNLHAGVGDDVVVCLGQPARRSLAAAGQGEGAGWGSPADAAVMAIVDRAA